MAHLRRSVSVLSLVLIVSLIGCKSGDRPPLGKVNGKVTIDGQPLTGVVVSFMPDKGRSANGISDSEGKYTIVYLEGAGGAKIGPNTVTFQVPTDGKPSHAIPSKYQSAGTSEFKVDVKAGSNTFDFDLKGGGAAAPEAKPAAVD